MKTKHLILASAVACVSTLAATSAGAQSHETVTTTGPNRELLHSGILAFTVPYAVSVVVAATSDRSEDKHLYIPVAGPWMDFANRSGCGHEGEPSCDKETAYKVLLVGNGILQGIGALEILGSFVFPETRTVSAKTEQRLLVTPYYAGNGGVGLSAFGRF
jgi:hypothetical protein